MKKIPLIHGKFRAKNNPMKFHFAVFMGHEMIFMGFSREIHGIFRKLQFIVYQSASTKSYNIYMTVFLYTYSFT